MVQWHPFLRLWFPSSALNHVVEPTSGGKGHDAFNLVYIFIYTYIYYIYVYIYIYIYIYIYKLMDVLPFIRNHRVSEI